MAGTVDLIQRCHTGIEMHDGVLWLKPCLPEGLNEIRQRIRYHGHWLCLHLTRETLTVGFEHGGAGPAKIGIGTDVHTFVEGDQLTFEISNI